MTPPADDELPQFHRTIRMPASLWQGVKERATQEGKTLHELVHDALDSELRPLVEALRAIGLVGEDGEQADKLVRVPMDENVVARINLGRRQTGVAAVELLLLCLTRHAQAAASRV
jgi:hypothetical protein